MESDESSNERVPGKLASGRVLARRISLAAVLTWIALGACSENTGCSKDTDCKDDRVCSAGGQCVDPTGSDGLSASNDVDGTSTNTTSSNSDDGASNGATSGASSSSADASMAANDEQLFADAPTVSVGLDETDDIERPVPRMTLASDGVAAGNTPIIDDFEDGENDINSVEGRRGGWFLYNDGTDGEQTPEDAPPESIPGGRADSEYAFHTTSSSFSDWGSGVGFLLVYSDDSTEYFYDASAYDGVTFWIRGSMVSAPETDTCELNGCTLRFGLQTPAVLPLESQGDCDDTLGSCWDVFGDHITLTDDWQRLSYRWQDLSQAGWGLPAVFNPQEIYAFIFEGRDSTTYDVWLDDIAFFSGDPPESDSIAAADDAVDDEPDVMVEPDVAEPDADMEPADAGL